MGKVLRGFFHLFRRQTCIRLERGRFDELLALDIITAGNRDLVADTVLFLILAIFSTSFVFELLHPLPNRVNQRLYLNGNECFFFDWLAAHALYSEFVIDMKIPAQRIQRLHIAIFQKRVDRQKGKVLPACVCGDKFVYCRFRQAGFFLNIGCGSCFAVIVTEQIADFAAEQVAHTQQFGKGRQSDAVFPLGYRLPRTNVYFFCKTILCQVELFPLCPYPFADFLAAPFVCLI